MSMSPLAVPLSDEEETILLGGDIAAALASGDLLALSGDLGSGKTSLARAIIRSLRADQQLEVPSPTFPIVQIYDGTPAISHFDLYRIGSADELEEIGIDEAIDNGIAIVEWADRFLQELPEPAFTVRLEEDGTGRLARITGNAGALQRLSRSFEIRKFLADQGWKRAWRRPLAGDASTRCYELVSLGDGAPRLIMNAPARPDGPPNRSGRPYSQVVHLAENVEPFVAIAAQLREADLAAPEIHAADLAQGILMMEYLGDGRFLDDGAPVADRYKEAARLLASIHDRHWPAEFSGPFGAKHLLPEYDRTAMLAEVELLVDWYLPHIFGREATGREREQHEEAWNLALDGLGNDRSIVLRDYHSPNLIWREDRQGRDRLGIIDFQDAVRGPTAYDVASLAQDARVRISRELEQEIVAAYCLARGAPGFDECEFRSDYAIMAAQRNAKVLGIFVRLDRRDGKPSYLRHLPHVEDYMVRSLAHEALIPVRQLYANWRLLQRSGT